jgi:hypothetical protein
LGEGGGGGDDDEHGEVVEGGDQFVEEVGVVVCDGAVDDGDRVVLSDEGEGLGFADGAKGVEDYIAVF